MAYINFGSRNLKLGLTGTDVGILQRLLNNLPTSIDSKVTESGNFDSATEASVKQFQSYFGLVPDGIVGKNTFLFFGQQIGPYLPPGAVVFGSRTLSIGSVGHDVWVLQNRLASTGAFVPPPINKYAIALGGPADSIYGPRTTDAVKLFQQEHGLAVNGITGPETLYKVLRLTFMGGRYLQLNNFERNQGYDVYFLQVHLKELGFDPGALDGKFGPATQMAVRALQRSVGITPDGVVGPDTYYHLAAA